MTADALREKLESRIQLHESTSAFVGTANYGIHASEYAQVLRCLIDAVTALEMIKRSRCSDGERMSSSFYAESTLAAIAERMK